MTDDETDTATFTGEAKSSTAVLTALKKAEDAFREWNAECEVIDQTYNRDGYGYAGRNTLDSGYRWQDSTLDLFWSSFEVMKPAIYARPPQPVVTPLFKDGDDCATTAAELLERCAVSVFKRADMGDVMTLMRDDLLFAGRGVPWLRYESENGEQKVCIEHKDRLDFLHEPARKWCEVGWVAGAAWLTRKDMRKRFAKTSGDAYKDAKYTSRTDETSNSEEQRAVARKCKVWEVWHRADGKTYWVSEGVDVLLDSGDPEIELDGFFPCPRPAYGTLRRRSLIPVPDWSRYAIHFDKISELTGRIYLLLDSVKMKGLIPAGSDIGDAIEQLLRSDDDQMLIPVPAAAMANGAEGFVAWMPLAEIATAISGLIEARTQLINDFYQLSGISDIMRGATEADETLGAQRLKSQFGSVRVREKSAELQRVAADAVKIATEIIAQKFSRKTMLDMSQMKIPTKADIEKRIGEVEKAAKAELKTLAEKAKDAAAQAQQGQQQVDPAQAKAMFEQAQQQVLAKYAPMLAEAEAQVPIEDVEKLVKTNRTRAFTFEIESSSTILTDELEEKQSRNEFMAQFATSSQAMMQVAALGEAGAELAGEMMKFALAPYRAGRTLDTAIDRFIQEAPKYAAQMAGKDSEGEELAQANKQLAEAELMKAKAAMAAVEAKSALDKAEMQRKLMQMQQDAQRDMAKAQQDNAKLQLQLADMQTKAEKTQAEIDNLTAQTAKILHSIGLDERKQELSEYTAASNEQARQTDQAMQAQGMQQDAQFRGAEQQRADRQHETETEFRERGESRADRQQEFTEQSMDERGA